VKVEVVVNDDKVDPEISSISRYGRSGDPAIAVASRSSELVDGKIFAINGRKTVWIRTFESGEGAR
jgi:nitrogen regulatory protein PII